jgi:hypothetical protein
VDRSRYDCDCSGFVSFVLKPAAPDHYALIPKEAGEPRPRAFEYHTFFNRLTSQSSGGFDDTGKGLFYAQVWLPNCPNPILNVRKGYETMALREKAIEDTLNAFDARNAVKVDVVKTADNPLDVPTFDPADFI